MSNKSDSGQKRTRHLVPNNNNVVEGDASRIPSEQSDTTSNALKSPTRSLLSIDEIDKALRVKTVMSALCRASDKEFSLSANYPKGHGQYFLNQMG